MGKCSKRIWHESVADNLISKYIKPAESIRNRLLSDVIWWTFALFSLAKNTSLFMLTNSIQQRHLVAAVLDEYQHVPGTQSSSKNLRSIVKIVLLSNIFSPSISGNIIRGSCHRRRIIKVSPKSIVVSAMESNDEINKFILLICWGLFSWFQNKLHEISHLRFRPRKKFKNVTFRPEYSRVRRWHRCHFEWL